MPDLGVSFGQPFAQQVAALRIRLGNRVPTQAWDDITRSAHDQSFMVAGAEKADLLADLAGAVDKAIEKGTTLEEFRKDFREIVARNGWTGWTGQGTEKGEAWRTRIIYQTNLRTSYAAGRYAQLKEAGYAYWIYKHSHAVHPRPQHLAWDGVALPPDHPFWATNYPPNGWGCGCEVRGAHTTAGIRRAGGDPGKVLPGGWDRRDARGLLPGIDKNWDYAPGATMADTINALSGKLPSLPAPIGAAMFASWPARAVQDLTTEFGKFVDRALSSHVQQNYMIVGALKPAWVSAAEQAGIRVETAEIAITDKNIQHTFRGTGLVTSGSTKRSTGRQPKVAPLDLDWFRQLPVLLQSPRAVLLDTTQAEPVFLLVYDVPGQMAKLVIELNTPVKKAKGMLNTVQSGRLITPNDLLATVDSDKVMMVDGKV